MKSSILKALIDCNQELGIFDLKNEEVDTIRHLVLSLVPVEFGSEKLRYYQQKRFFSLVLNELDLLNNPISRNLYEAIIKRIEQRRNRNLVGMLQ